MKKRICLIAGLSVAACAFQTVPAQMLPSHGAAAAGRTPAFVESSTQYVPSAAWRKDLGIDLIYIPSPKDDRFDDALGIGLNVTFPLQSIMAVRAGVGMESFEGKTGVEDADVVPLSLSFLIGPPIEGPVSVGLELGLRYNFIDYTGEGGEYDDGVGGLVGLNITAGATSGFALEFGVGYRFDISESENDAGDELSLEGVALKLALRFSF